MKCVILFTIDDLYDGNGKKTPKYTKTKTKEKIPRLIALPPPVYKNGGRLFSGDRKHRKQAGPTLGETGILV